MPSSELLIGCTGNLGQGSGGRSGKGREGNLGNVVENVERKDGSKVIYSWTNKLLKPKKPQGLT